MSLSTRKKQELFEFYSKNGFQHSTEQIVKELNICHKTFFNRYGTKANSVEIAWKHWQSRCKEKWLQILENCNHSIEELIMTMYSIVQTKQEEPHYYEYTRETRKYLNSDSIFYELIQTALEKGKRCFHINNNLDLDIYTPYLLNNLFLIDIEHDNRPQIMRFILHPALTERGMDLLLETPFA